MPTILTKGEGELPDYCLFSRTISARNKNFKVTVEKKKSFFSQLRIKPAFTRNKTALFTRQ